MSLARLEEYAKFQNGLPFLLHANLQRTKQNQNKIANWHENLEIQLCTQGKGWVLLNGEEIPFEKGDLVIANSGVLHYTATDDFLQYSCLILDTNFCRAVGVDCSQFLFPVRLQKECLRTIFEDLQAEYLSQNALRTVKLHSLLLNFLALLCEMRVEKETNAKEEKNLQSMKRVVQFIRENFNKKLSLETLATVALCDKYQLTRAFKRATGQTVITFINRVRCQHAANYIANGESAGNAALLCGFENFSYFSKTFQKFMGKLPSDYAKTH